MNAAVATKWQPRWALHPGEILLEFTTEHCIPLSMVARVARVSNDYVNGVIMGRERISERLAYGLEEILESGAPPASLWLNLQAQYDEAQVSNPDDDEVNPLMGVSEVAAFLGIARTTLWGRRGRRGRSGFPHPDLTLAMGPLWRLSTVKAYADRLRSTDGRRTTKSKEGDHAPSGNHDG